MVMGSAKRWVTEKPMVMGSVTATHLAKRTATVKRREKPTVMERLLVTPLETG
jgi:hypothetical protein